MSIQLSKSRSNRPTRWVRLGLYLGLIVVGGFSIFPFLWMLFSSFKPLSEIYATRSLLPEQWTLEGYKGLFSQTNMVRATWNSFFIAFTASAVSVFFCALGGYAFAKFRFPGREALFAIMLASMTVPFAVIMIPLFIIMRNLQWIDTPWPLVIPGAANAFGIFFMRQYMFSVSDEILDAARIDGASELSIFLRVVLPISIPGLASLGIIFFMGSWNNFLWPLTILRSPEKHTLPILLTLLQSDQGRTPYDIIMAGSVLSVVPMLIVFLFLQRYFYSGFTAGSVKG